MKWNSQPRAEFFVEAVSIAFTKTGDLLMYEQVRVELFQLASFVAGSFCQKRRTADLVSCSERFNVAMCIAWIVQAVDTILSPYSRAQLSKSAKKFDTYSGVPK
jgi:hypothetical protein